jgi:hypothetical protein
MRRTVSVLAILRFPHAAGIQNLLLFIGIIAAGLIGGSTGLIRTNIRLLSTQMAMVSRTLSKR